MIDAYTIANKIENRLNEIAKGAEAPFVFKVYPEVGDYKAAILDETRKTLPQPVVNCTLMSLPSQIVPLQNVRSYTMSQLLTVMAPLAPGIRKGTEEFERSIEPVMDILRAFVEDSAGYAGTIPEEPEESEELVAYVFAPQLPSVGVEANTGVGFWFAPVSVYFTWQFIEGGVVGNNVKITVGGQEAVLLEGGFSRTRIADTNPREGSEEMTTVIGQQGLTLRVLVPYISGGVGQQLVTDALTGALDKTYAVTYSDGVAFTDSSPFAADMVTTGISFSFNPGTTCSVDATFVLADGEVYDNA